MQNKRDEISQRFIDFSDQANLILSFLPFAFVLFLFLAMCFTAAMFSPAVQ